VLLLLRYTAATATAATTTATATAATTTATAATAATHPMPATSTRAARASASTRAVRAQTRASKSTTLAPARSRRTSPPGTRADATPRSPLVYDPVTPSYSLSPSPLHKRAPGYTPCYSPQTPTAPTPGVPPRMLRKLAPGEPCWHLDDPPLTPSYSPPGSQRWDANARTFVPKLVSDMPDPSLPPAALSSEQVYLQNTSRTEPSLPLDVAKLPLNLDGVEDAPRTPTLVWDANARTFTPKFKISDMPDPSTPQLHNARKPSAVQLEARRLTAEFKAKQQRLNKPQAQPQAQQQKKSRCGQKRCHWCAQEATTTATATATATAATTTTITNPV